MTTAQVLTMSLESFVPQVGSQFMVTDNHCSSSFGNADNVTEMVPMPVGKQDEVRLGLAGGYAGGGIVREKWIDQYFVTADLQSQSGVSVPGYCYAHIDLLNNSFY